MEATKTRKRQHLTQGERATMQNEALDRAEHGRTCGNDLLILTAFAARGINATPRVDCFTFNAWRALGRHVKKGEHGVHVPVYAHVEDVDQATGEKTEHTIPTGATVFHVSQTDPDEKPTPGVAITADGIAPCELSGDTVTLTEPTRAEKGQAFAAFITAKYNLDEPDADALEDDHEAAILEEEQREEASYTGPAYVIEDPLTGSIIGRSPAKSTTTADNQPALF